MAIKLKLVDQVWWPVTIHVPADGGRTEAAEIRARFRLLTHARFLELSRQGDLALLEATLVDWDGIEDEQGKPLALTPQTRAQALQIVYVRAGLIAAFLQANQGAAAKN